MQKTIYGPPPQCSTAVTPPQPPGPVKAAPVIAYIKRVTDIMTNLKAKMDKEVALERIDTLKAEVEVVLTRTPAK
jgi:hypothetical protein